MLLLLVDRERLYRREDQCYFRNDKVVHSDLCRQDSVKWSLPTLVDGQGCQSGGAVEWINQWINHQPMDQLNGWASIVAFSSPPKSSTKVGPTDSTLCRPNIWGPAHVL